MLDLSAKPAHLRQAQRPDALPAPRTPLDENCTMGAGPGLCVLSVLRAPQAKSARIGRGGARIGRCRAGAD